MVRDSAARIHSAASASTSTGFRSCWVPRAGLTLLRMSGARAACSHNELQPTWSGFVFMIFINFAAASRTRPVSLLAARPAASGARSPSPTVVAQSVHRISAEPAAV